MCLYPKLVQNPKYKSNAKNGGNIPQVKDDRVLYVPIACGNCMECRNKKAREWQVRLTEDIKQNKNAKFITFTLSNESIAELSTGIIGLQDFDLDNEIATLAIRRWLERHRKKYGKSIRHWLVTELGHNGTENIHLHGIIWTDKKLDLIEQLWSYGYIWKGKRDKSHNNKLINYVNEQTINYIIKYITKTDEIYKNYKPRILTSKGIGNAYTKGQDAKRNKYKSTGTNETYKTKTGHKISLPIYWRNKIFSEEEREELWLQKLDKEERWVCGNRVSIKKDEKNYYNLLETQRKKNNELGYGDNKKNWDRIEYEKQRRNIMVQTRIKKAKQKQSKTP